MTTETPAPACRCDGGAYEAKAHPFLVHPDCPVHAGQPEGRWAALIVDEHGYVMDDEAIRAWCADQEAAEAVNDSVPTYLLIVTGTAAPDGEGINRRVPGQWHTADRFLDTDVDTYDGAELLELWERARKVAAAMNRAGVA